MFKIAYSSDFHFEFYNFKTIYSIIDAWVFDNDTQCIIIAGDLHVGAKSVERVLKYIHKTHNIVVIFVPGNHEYYGSSFEKQNILFEKFAGEFDYFVLNRNNVCINNIKFIGCTGNIDGSYKDINVYDHGALNDFHQIRDFQNHYSYGTQDRKYVEENLKNVYKDIIPICITHTMPSPKCISDKYVGDVLNACFVNDWEYLFHFDDAPKYHICGHTHDSVDIVVGKTRVLSNPYGYPRENKSWKWEYIYV